MTVDTIVAVVGANGGVGQAVCQALNHYANIKVIRVSTGTANDLCDFTNDEGVRCAFEDIMFETDDDDPGRECHRILINCVGVNYIEWFPKMDFGEFDRLMRINVRSHLDLIQRLITLDKGSWFKSQNGNGTICEIISNASHMPMTNSAFYNASKAAQHGAFMSLARELRKTDGICIFGISPNKLAGTGMSTYIEGRVPELRGWTPEEAHKYQLSALPAGEETDVDVMAEFIAFLMSSQKRHKYLTNTVISYGA